ncbi:MAG: HD domain-containing protein [Desulfobacterales bacterium]|nr:HD domain-containing protein [Desulfobacterales bacterium]
MNRESENYPESIVLSILKINEELNHLKDVDTILDRILFEARMLSSADAGSIFLVEGNFLNFSYVHNDTLFRKDETNAALYADFKEPVNEKSIVGYAGLTGETVVIEDVYNMSDTLPYTFNPSYDLKSGYKTTSVFSIPLKTFRNKLVGVMQLINAKDEQGRITPFSHESQIYVPLFANNASVAIEQGIMNRELILRMMKMAELRDPTETGSHVQRVGAYSAEIYQKLALSRGVDRKEIKRTRDLIRLASMLHDVGKVGISDSILKKPAKLTEKEFDTMKWHTVLGARLFVHTTSNLDKMSCEIALNHHEKWRGGGYPGKIPDIFSEEIAMGTPKKGEEIPLAARITTLADVFDALASKRSYKEPMSDDEIFKIIEKDSGTHFDPEIVQVFFDIFGVIKAIREKFKG